MTSTTLGRSGPLVSRLGLGLAALGRPGYINLGHGDVLGSDRDVEALRDRAFLVLDRAWSRGVRYFDAARSYGRAEEFLASWLHSRAIEPRSVVVGSKWGYTYTADWQVEADLHEVKDHSLGTLKRQAGETLAVLGEDLALYQIHSATRESGVLDDRAVLEELARLKAEAGWKIGLSTTGAGQSATIRQALTIEVDGRRLFDAVQSTWNLLEPSSGPALAEAHAQGLGVIVKEALANGRLTSQNLDPAFASNRLVLEAEATRRETTVDALALSAVLAQPWADVVLSGAASTAQLDANLASLDLSGNDPLGSALAPLAEPPEVYWLTRSRLPWN